MLQARVVELDDYESRKSNVVPFGVKLTEDGTVIAPLYVGKDSIGLRYDLGDIKISQYDNPTKQAIGVYARVMTHLSGYNNNAIPWHSRPSSPDDVVNFMLDGNRMQWSDLERTANRALERTSSRAKEVERVLDNRQIISYTVGQMLAERFGKVYLLEEQQ
ncbi:hypothetical protein COY27_00780 [Candidatus Woesearchaeota archaeon CG_4_10_14_0_2_um_filter_33_13]|nr:MAG: hypothetical protein COY27_00780 [Candidatus Woesearchaeota archaeon CG_4_10_14_0_2_um_filter_33_13]